VRPAACGRRTAGVSPSSTPAHRAQADQARAVLDEQSADYRAVVLTAYRRSRTTCAIRRLREERKVRPPPYGDRQGLQQSQYRYKPAGTYLEVVINETAYLQAATREPEHPDSPVERGVLLTKRSARMERRRTWRVVREAPAGR